MDKKEKSIKDMNKEELIKKLEELDKTIVQRNREAVKYKKKYDVCKEKTQRIQDEIDNEKAKLERLKLEFEDFDNKCRNLESTLAALTISRNDLCGERNKVMKEIKELEALEAADAGKAALGTGKAAEAGTSGAGKEKPVRKRAARKKKEAVASEVKEEASEVKEETSEIKEEADGVLKATFDKEFMWNENPEVVEDKPVRKRAARKKKEASKVEEKSEERVSLADEGDKPVRKRAARKKKAEASEIEEDKPVRKRASRKKKEEPVEKESLKAPEVEEHTEPVENAIEKEVETEKKKIDIMYSFDTTGSMYTVLSLVRKNIEESINKMFNLDCDIRVGVIAHGDYCDAGKPYTIMAMDLTSDKQKLVDFVKTIESTNGGDFDECYELVLRTLNTDVSWREDSSKMVVLIGDATPHDVRYKLNKDKLDWVTESKNLKDKGVSIYAVHALSNFRKCSTSFYKSLAENTDGIYLTLDNFSDVNSLIVASLYQRFSKDKLNEYVTVIRDSGEMTRTLAENVNRLAGNELVHDKYESIYGLNIVPAGRFQVMEVDENCDIKGFVQKNGIVYKVGRAFYELTKTEDVQQYKEVILQDKVSGDMYYGADTRKHLGLLEQCTRSGKYGHEKIKPVKDDKYRVFVQSTSVNRKLLAGTNMLYEIGDI